MTPDKLQNAQTVRRKLLLIEDDSAVAESIKLFLKSGYELHSASTVRSGVRRFKALHPSLVILDMRLPDKNGVEALRQIRSVNQTPVIVLTGHASMTSVEECLRLGAQDYLHKPFDGFAFKKRVDQLALPLYETVPDSPLDTSKLHQFGLSRREFDVLHWIIEGKQNPEIATILSLSVRTVEHHVSAILKKLGVETRTTAATLALRIFDDQGHGAPVDNE